MSRRDLTTQLRSTASAGKASLCFCAACAVPVSKCKDSICMQSYNYAYLQGPQANPQPGQMIIGYQVFEPEVGNAVAPVLFTCCLFEVTSCLKGHMLGVRETLDVLQTGCCQADDLSLTGWIAVILLVFIIWPLFWIPCVIPDCYDISTWCSSHECHARHLLSCECICYTFGRSCISDVYHLMRMS